MANGFFFTISNSAYGGRKLPESSRLRPNAVWARSLVPKLLPPRRDGGLRDLVRREGAARHFDHGTDQVAELHLLLGHDLFGDAMDDFGLAPVGSVWKRPPESTLPLTMKLATLLAMSKTVNVAEFKDRFSELLALVEAGGEVIVCRRNVPLARVEAIRKATPRKPPRSVVGCMKGTVRIHGDLTEPCVPEEDWEMLK